MASLWQVPNDIWILDGAPEAFTTSLDCGTKLLGLQNRPFLLWGLWRILPILMPSWSLMDIAHISMLIPQHFPVESVCRPTKKPSKKHGWTMFNGQTLEPKTSWQPQAKLPLIFIPSPLRLVSRVAQVLYRLTMGELGVIPQKIKMDINLCDIHWKFTVISSSNPFFWCSMSVVMELFLSWHSKEQDIIGFVKLPSLDLDLIQTFMRLFSRKDPSGSSKKCCVLGIGPHVIRCSRCSYILMSTDISILALFWWKNHPHVYYINLTSLHYAVWSDLTVFLSESIRAKQGLSGKGSEIMACTEKAQWEGWSDIRYPYQMDMVEQLSPAFWSDPKSSDFYQDRDHLSWFREAILTRKDTRSPRAHLVDSPVLLDQVGQMAPTWDQMRWTSDHGDPGDPGSLPVQAPQ